MTIGLPGMVLRYAVRTIRHPFTVFGMKTGAFTEGLKLALQWVNRPKAMPIPSRREVMDARPGRRKAARMLARGY